MCPPDLRRANDDEDESSRRRALRATATFGATVRDSSGGGDGETAPRKSRRECHVAVVVDVSRECLSEDCRGGFDSAGNATRVTRLRAMCVAARALASGADSACAFVSEASSSENGRSESPSSPSSPSRRPSRRGENRALFVATNKRETRDALESLERAIHDAASPVRTAGASRDDALVTKEGPRTSTEHRSREELLPNGASLPTALRLAAMALMRMSPSGGKNARASAVAASPEPPPPRRSILVLLASDGACRARDEKKHIEDIASAIQKLRAFDADAKCHVLRVAPPRDEERFGTLTSAMTKCADCSAREDSDEKKKKVCDKDGVHDCVSCGTCLTRTRNIVWSAAGFGKTHLARAAFRRRVFGDDDDDVFFFGDDDDEKKNVAVAVPETTTDITGSSSSSSSSFSSSSPTPSARVGGVCGTDHAAALEVLSAGFFSRAEVEARLESAQRESATLGVETRRVVAVEDEDKKTFLRVERRVARFHAEDIPPTVAALTSPLASVRAGRLLETRAGKGKTETLRLSPESLSAVHPLRAKTARFDERLELWLEVDGALRVVHVRDENRTDTLARIGAGAADALRRLAAATRELEARRTENASQARVAESEKKPEKKPRTTMDDDDARRRRVISHPLPNDASRRAFRLIAGTGAGSRASYFWLRDARVEDGARALACFAEKLRNPPTLSDATRVPPERLEALASAAPALGEIASSFPGFANRESIARRVARLARDVKRVEAERARREEADARARRVERARRETKKNSFSRKKLDEKKMERDASSSETRLEARARAALIATRVFGEASALPPPREPRPERETRPEPEPTTAPALEPSGRGAAATGQSGANKKRGLCARTSAASVPLPPGARVTAANVASLFATEVVQSGDAESDEETRERERR